MSFLMAKPPRTDSVKALTGRLRAAAVNGQPCRQNGCVVIMPTTATLNCVSPGQCLGLFINTFIHHNSRTDGQTDVQHKNILY